MTIGSQLRQAREAQSLSLDQVAQATHIRLHYLEAMEADNFELLPSTAQLRGFLRAYSDYLKLNTGELIQALASESKTSLVQLASPVPASELRFSSSSSASIFKEIGSKLQAQRELMGLSLGDVERHTHIRMHYIQALETGDISHLPSPVQGRGMLSNYASFLGLDTETILLLFADGLQADLYDRQAARNVKVSTQGNPAEGKIPSRPSPLKRLFSTDFFVGGFIIVFLLGFSIWGALRISKINSAKEPSPTAPSVSELLLSTPIVGISETPFVTTTVGASIIPATITSSSLITSTAEPQPVETQVVYAATPGIQNAPLQLNIIPSQRAWLRVVTDGETVFEGRVMPGSAYSFAGNERIELLTGDGSSLRVYFNQQDLGVLGSLGEVVERIFTIEGVLTATPSVPSTSTPAPTQTATPIGSGTPLVGTTTPTPTARP
jgi:cytoskeletal protein RodZ